MWVPVAFGQRGGRAIASVSEALEKRPPPLPRRSCPVQVGLVPWPWATRVVGEAHHHRPGSRRTLLDAVPHAPMCHSFADETRPTNPGPGRRGGGPRRGLESSPGRESCAPRLARRRPRQRAMCLVCAFHPRSSCRGHLGPFPAATSNACVRFKPPDHRNLPPHTPRGIWVTVSPPWKACMAGGFGRDRRDRKGPYSFIAPVHPLTPSEPL